MKPVKLYEATEQIDEHNQLPLNPHPPYGLLTGYHCYPYLFYGSKQFQVTRRKVKILTAENEYLKIGMAPAYGGRLWSMYDKINKREVIHRVHTAALIYNAGMGFNYMGGGLELNLPNAHSYTNVRKRFCTALKNENGSVSLVMSNTEKVGRIHWMVSFTLFPGEARVIQKVRIANETPFEERYLYWANCGIPVGANTEFIYPETGGAQHGNFENIVSWSMFMKKNIAVLKNIDGMFGLYMLGAREGYFGYYDHDEKSGLLHYADVNDLPGKKYWSWGWHASGQHTAFDHTDCGKCYGEVQSGRIVIQEEFDRILPMTNAAWTEYWYPYREIGVVNGASANAGVNFSLAPSGKKSRADLRIYANRAFGKTDILLRKGEKIITSFANIALRPGEPFILEKYLAVTKAEQDEIRVEIVDKKEGLIAATLPKREKAKETDSYFLPEKLPVKTAQDFTAEGYFFRAEKLAREWMFHLPEIKNLLAESLKIDANFSRAHNELGLIYLRGGDFKKALEHFDKSLERIYDDGRILYYKGLALWFSGNVKEAIYHLRQAGRFGYECQERVAEAQIAIRQKDYAKAVEHLRRALAINGSVVLADILLALVFRRLKKNDDAALCLAVAKQESPFSPLVPAAEYILKECSPVIRKAIHERYRDLPEEILEAVSLFYLSGLIEEAADILAIMPVENDITALYRARLAKETGRRIRKAARSNPDIAPDFAWKIEDYLMLSKNLSESQNSARNYYHLGNFYYAHGFEEEGINAWEKACRKGERGKVLLYEMARAYARKKSRPEYKRLLREAFRADRKDPYIYDDYVGLVYEEKGQAKGIAFLEKNIRRVKKYFTTAGMLLRSYITSGKYEKAERFMAEIDFTCFWRAALSYYYVVLRLAQGYRQLTAGNYSEAYAYFDKALAVPENVGRNYFIPYPERARRLFYMGLCRKFLGQEEQARKHWEEALSLDQQADFELSYDFQTMKTRYYQVFCLRGLGRHSEAEVYCHGIKKLAQCARLPEGSKRLLLRWGYLAGEKDITKTDRFDTELGITAFTYMATSVED